MKKILTTLLTATLLVGCATSTKPSALSKEKLSARSIYKSNTRTCREHWFEKNYSTRIRRAASR